MGSNEKMYYYLICYYLVISFCITYHDCYTIEMNPYGNLMYPTLSNTPSSASSAKLRESPAPTQSAMSKYHLLSNEDQLITPYTNDRFNYDNNDYDYYQQRHHPKMSKRADLRDLSIHSDMAFLRKLFDQKNHELLRLG
ncbi:unnamed protein product [Schistosoma turkestanicum]|nr:unnamed protein product [Schistosoma turkestanicum]